MEKLEDAHKFLQWKRKLRLNGLEVHGIEEKFTRRNAAGDVLFSVIMLDATTPEGPKIPPICFLKGEVVTVLVCLIDRETGERFLVLVCQRRIADGGLSYEHPAGMVDGTCTALQIAVQEVAEETGIVLNENQLTPLLSARSLYPSTGTSDECMNFFFTELQYSREEIEAINHRNTGVEEEHITTVVLPFAEAHQLMTNTNCILLNLAYLTHQGEWELLRKLSV